MLVTIEPSSDLLYVCPGRRSVSFNCSVEPLQSNIQWEIWCQCSADRCRDTCTDPMTIVPTIVSTGNTSQSGTVCAQSPAITYKNNFTTVMQDGNTNVPFSVLSIAVSLDFQQQSTTSLCLLCEDQVYRHLQVLGTGNKFQLMIYSFDYLM